jgi:hypothetical protein
MGEEKCCKNRAENGTIPARLGLALDVNYFKVSEIGK